MTPLLTAHIVSILLFIYGKANIIGNILVGKLLSWNPRRTVIIIPFLMLPVYAPLFLCGDLSLPTALIILALRILTGIASNCCQCMISSPGPEEPEFANGLFLTGYNLGTTIGTAFCGLIITTLGTRYSATGAFVLLALGIICIFLRDNVAKNMSRINLII